MLKNYLVNKDFDLMEINPFVRKVNKIYTTYETHNVPIRELYDYSMIVMLDGKLNFDYDGQTVTLEVGEIVIIPPFIMHKEFMEKQCSAKYFVVNFDLFYSPERRTWRVQEMYLKSCRAGVTKMDRDPHYMMLDNNAGVFCSLMKMKVKNINTILEILQKMYEIDIHTLFTPLTTEEQILLKSYLLKIFSILFQMEDVAEERRYSEKINAFVEFALINYSQDIDISKKALELGFSPNFFSKIFKKEVGITPFAYLQQIRINEAKLLLARGLPVKDVAKMVGYSDALYFGKVFKKQIGVSPAVYKKNIVDKTEFDIF